MPANRTLNRTTQAFGKVTVTGTNSVLKVTGTHALGNFGNLAPLPDGATLEPGRLVNIHHLFGAEAAAAQIEALSIIVSASGTTSTLKEAIDAVVSVTSANDTGEVQTIAAAVKKTSASTNATGFSFAAWPQFFISAGTITTGGGLRVYGVQNTGGGAIGTFAGVQIDATSLEYTNWYGISVGAKTGAATTVSVACLLTQPVGGAAHALWLERSATTQPTMIWRNLAGSTVTITVPTTVTSYTLTLPPDDGTSGQVLHTNGSGVTTWDTDDGSSRELKVITGRLTTKKAIDRIMALPPVSTFRYDPDAKGVGGDYETEFTGYMADEVPWLMKNRGTQVSVINAFGTLAPVVQNHEARLRALEKKSA